MNQDDIVSIWVNDDDMDLCEYCMENCPIGGKCLEFNWNGKIPPGVIQIKHDPDKLFEILPALNRFEKDML